MQISIAIPCFNEEANIADTVQEALRWFDASNIDGEIIVVNDGSTDQSQEVLEQLQKSDNRISIICHKENRGYGIAVRSGCDAAKKEWIAFVDSDRQFHITDLDLLLKHIHQYAFIAGRRKKRADPCMRNAFGKLLGILNFLVFHMWIRDVNCGMKMFSAEIWSKIRPEYGTEKFFNTELFLRLKVHNIPWVQVDVPHFPRKAGSPTGGSIRVIGKMFTELHALKSGMQQH